MLGLEGYKLFLAMGVFLAGVHAHTKLSPYFAATWFGSGLVFSYAFAGRDSSLELVLLPPLVFYLAAAVTKGLVETRDGLKGNHVVHVLTTGLFSGVIALPILSAAQGMGWRVPGEVPDLAFLSGLDPAWLGGVSPDAVVLWMTAGFVFYGVYKILDHTGLGRPAQTVLQFAAAWFLPSLVTTLLGGG